MKKLITTLAVLAMTSVATAEEGFKISGDVATSIFTGSGENPQGTGAAGLAGSTKSDFSVDLAELNLEKTLGNTSVHLGLGFGRLFDNINYSIGTGAAAPKSTLNLTNAYINHKIGDTGLSVKLGKFESFMGYETYNYMDNMNYTRSYAFYNTMPWYHTGLNLNYGTEMFDVGLYVVNSTLNIDTDENKTKTLGASVAVRPMEGLSVKLNYLTGKINNLTTLVTFNPIKEDLTIINAIAAYTVSNFDVAVSYTLNTQEEDTGAATEEELSSLAAYLGYKMESWGAGLRYEMFNDKPSVGAENDISAFTLSGYYDVDQNARVKLEVGTHSGDLATFVDDDGVADDKMTFYGAAFMYRF